MPSTNMHSLQDRECVQCAVNKLLEASPIVVSIKSKASGTGMKNKAAKSKVKNKNKNFQSTFQFNLFRTNQHPILWTNVQKQNIAKGTSCMFQLLHILDIV